MLIKPPDGDHYFLLACGHWIYLPETYTNEERTGNEKHCWRCKREVNLILVITRMHDRIFIEER